MNWGKGVAIALGLFITFIVILVVGFFSHKVDLESENYYEREIAYEEEIEAMRNANKLDQQINLSMDEGFVVVNIPEGNFEEIQLEMLRPNDMKADQIHDIQGTKTYTIPKSDLKKGKYKVAISYKQEGKVCLQKNEIYIK